MNLLSNVIIPLIIFGNIILLKNYKFEYHQIFTPLLKIFYVFLAYIMIKKFLYRLERILFNFLYSNDIMDFEYKIIMLSLIIPILSVPLTILLLHFIIMIYDFLQNIINFLYKIIINYIYRTYKYEITDTIINLNKNTNVLLTYKSKNIFINHEYLSPNKKTTILDNYIYLKFTDKNLLDKLLYNSNNIYNIKYNGLFEINQITNLTDFYLKTLNKIFVSDITNIILNFLFKINYNSKDLKI
jgi:hypothetical protein